MIYQVNLLVECIFKDLVIEQTFEMVNTFLMENQNTRKRNLRIKTYKVNFLFNDSFPI